jgi:hypothetical protein
VGIARHIVHVVKVVRVVHLPKGIVCPEWTASIKLVSSHGQIGVSGFVGSQISVTIWSGCNAYYWTWNMSKGIGGLQRALLAAIQERFCIDTLEATASAYKLNPIGGCIRISKAKHAAARRALAGLAKRGLIVILAQHLELPVRLRRYRDENGDWLRRALWCTPEYAEDRVRDRHCRHHPPPPDPTQALSFWD